MVAVMNGGQLTGLVLVFVGACLMVLSFILSVPEIIGLWVEFYREDPVGALLMGGFVMFMLGIVITALSTPSGGSDVE